MRKDDQIQGISQSAGENLLNTKDPKSQDAATIKPGECRNITTYGRKLGARHARESG